MGKKAFLIDADKCTGCKLCIVACKDEHVGNDHMPWTKPQPETGHFWIDVKPLERGSMPRLRMNHLPLNCQHCENAPCIKACPEDAIKRRDDGLVWIDATACTGCGLCQPACPYDVIYMNAELAVAQKCTGCAHRVDEGALPRCAEICPHEAILFGDETDAIFAAGGKPLDVFHPEYQAAPRVFWKGLPTPWIAGTVVDPDADEALSGVAVTAHDLFESGSVTVQSDGFGDFWVRGMARGRKYRVEISKAGYQDQTAIVTTDGDQDLGTVYLKKAR